VQGTIQELIENLRQEMYKASKNSSLTDPSVIEISQELDRLLNHYLSYLTERKIPSD